MQSLLVVFLYSPGLWAGGIPPLLTLDVYFHTCSQRHHQWAGFFCAFWYCEEHCFSSWIFKVKDQPQFLRMLSLATVMKLRPQTHSTVQPRKIRLTDLYTRRKAELPLASLLQHRALSFGISKPTQSAQLPVTCHTDKSIETAYGPRRGGTPYTCRDVISVYLASASNVHFKNQRDWSTQWKA